MILDYCSYTVLLAAIHETNAVPVVFTTHAALFFGPSFLGIILEIQNFNTVNATRPLSQCYQRSYLVKKKCRAHKEPSKKYKSHPRTPKSKSYELCRTKLEYYNNKAPYFLTAGLQIFPI